MSPVVQDLIVVAIVACAMAYAGLRLMPSAWRRAAATAVADRAARLGLSQVLARRVEAKLASGGACGSCDSCRACATPAAGSGNDEAAVVAASSMPYRKIPIRRA